MTTPQRIREPLTRRDLKKSLDCQESENEGKPCVPVLSVHCLVGGGVGVGWGMQAFGPSSPLLESISASCIKETWFIISFFFFFFFFFFLDFLSFFFGYTHGIWKFLGQGPNLSSNFDLCYSCHTVDGMETQWELL